MISDELIKNKVSDLKEVLEDLSSKDERKLYKASVPYVHVPEELIEQWADHWRMIREVKWYNKLFTCEEIELMNSLDEKVNKFSQKHLEDMPDVSEIFANQEWQNIMEESMSVLNSISASITKLLLKYSTEQENARE